MNPFDLRGPQFLFFYLLLTAVVLLAIKIVRSRRELALGETRMLARLQDPYLIACLRGDESEVIRVAIVSLVDRGLLTVVNGDSLRTTDTGLSLGVRKTIERELLKKCTTAQVATSLFKDKELLPACNEYGAELQRQGLLPTREVSSARLNIFLAAAGVLLFFAVGKMIVGVMRDRPIGFLIILTFISLLFVVVAAFPRRTALGERFLRDLRNVFESLKLRAPQIRSGGATAELALLAGVYGVGALPAEEFGWSRTLFPKASASASGTSSCGSSSGSSCGSSCGGGCGGGCGGCGG